MSDSFSLSPSLTCVQNVHEIVTPEKACQTKQTSTDSEQYEHGFQIPEIGYFGTRRLQVIQEVHEGGDQYDERANAEVRRQREPEEKHRNDARADE
jgi:hypothetical protein